MTDAYIDESKYNDKGADYGWREEKYFRYHRTRAIRSTLVFHSIVWNTTMFQLLR